MVEFIELPTTRTYNGEIQDIAHTVNIDHIVRFYPGFHAQEKTVVILSEYSDGENAYILVDMKYDEFRELFANFYRKRG